MQNHSSSLVLANNLRRLRIQKNYTQEQVAEILGVSSQSVSRWECGNTLPDVMLLPEIAKLYCITIDDLYKDQALAYKNYAQRLLAVYEATGQTDDFLKAETEFEKMFATSEYSLEDLRLCGVLYHYMMKNCIEKALKHFDRVLEAGYKNKDDSEVYYRTYRQKIYMLSEIGKNEENIKTQLLELEKDSDDVNRWICLIAAYFFAGKYDDGYEVAQKAIRKFEDVPELYVYAGDISRKLKKYEEAFIFWEKAYELDNTYLDAKYSIGFCYEEKGQYDKAYGIWTWLAEELGKRGLQIEKEYPHQLAMKCQKKFSL